MKRLKLCTFIFLAILFVNSRAFAATFAIDSDHSTVSFKIRHLLSNVQGNFRKFEGVFDYDPEKPNTWKANATIDAASIDTNVEKRDNHLRSADFFDVAKFPTIRFTSTEITEATETGAKLHGILSMHGVEKPVVLDLEIYGIAQDPTGGTRAGFTATTVINRKDFGISWNKALEAGQLLVGEEVKITIEVEGVLQN